LAAGMALENHSEMFLTIRREGNVFEEVSLKIDAVVLQVSNPRNIVLLFQP